jgi:hypothetical protein
MLFIPIIPVIPVLDVLPDLFCPTIMAQPESLDHTAASAVHTVAVEEDSVPITPVVPWRIACCVFDVDAGVNVHVHA